MTNKKIRCLQFISAWIALCMSASNAATLSYTEISLLSDGMKIHSATISPNEKLIVHGTSVHPRKPPEVQILNVNSGDNICVTCDSDVVKEELLKLERYRTHYFEKGTCGFCGPFIWSPDSTEVIVALDYYGWRLYFRFELSTRKLSFLGKDQHLNLEKTDYFYDPKSDHKISETTDEGEYFEAVYGKVKMEHSLGGFKYRLMKREVSFLYGGQRVRREVNQILLDRPGNSESEVIGSISRSLWSSKSGELLGFRHLRDDETYCWRAVHTRTGKWVEFDRKKYQIVGWLGDKLIVVTKSGLVEIAFDLSPPD